MKEILFAGSGGQGVLTSGEVMLNVAIAEDYKATWTPEYGSAMRGGDASCTVKFSKSEIYNPMREEPDVLLAMNQSSLDKHLDSVSEDGVVVINSDMVQLPEDIREDLSIVKVPCMTLSEEIKHPRGANIIMAAVILRETGFEEEAGLKGMNDMFNKAGKGKFEEANTKAFKAGYSFK